MCWNFPQRFWFFSGTQMMWWWPVGCMGRMPIRVLLGCHLTDWRPCEYTENSLSTVNKKPVWADWKHAVCRIIMLEVSIGRRLTTRSDAVVVPKTPLQPQKQADTGDVCFHIVWHFQTNVAVKGQWTTRWFRGSRGPSTSIRSCGYFTFAFLKTNLLQCFLFFSLFPANSMDGFVWETHQGTSKLCKWNACSIQNLIFFPVTLRPSLNFGRKIAILSACLNVSRCCHVIGWLHILRCTRNGPGGPDWVESDPDDSSLWCVSAQDRGSRSDSVP